MFVGFLIIVFAVVLLTAPICIGAIINSNFRIFAVLCILSRFRRKETKKSKSYGVCPVYDAYVMSTSLSLSHIVNLVVFVTHFFF